MTLTEFLEEHGIPYMRHGEHHHVTEGWLGVDCPYCSPHSGSYRLGLHEDGRGANCWTCGPHRTWDILCELTNTAAVADFFRVTNNARDRPRVDSPNGKLMLPKGLGPLLPPHRKYLKGRGFDPDELAKLWGLKGIGIAPKLSWRIFIPLRRGEKTVSWTTRAVVDHIKHRYVNAGVGEEEVPHKSVLLGEEMVRHSVIVCEGPLDAMKIGPGAVATMGVNVSDEQVLRITRYPVRVVCLDSEAEAQRRALALCDRLEVFPGKTVNVVLDSKDPGSASPREIKKLRRFL